ncbi:helix-turn-helix domain-containing protein [Sphingobacterium gobiense]|nr:helix-turn-helix transcriptional regulator [Sphingobacterium gobiense]
MCTIARSISYRSLLNFIQSYTKILKILVCLLFKIRTMLYLADNMRYLRAKWGRSQQQLADELGITRTRYSKYEYGMAEPPIALLVKIAKYYGLSIDEIISVDLYRV